MMDLNFRPLKRAFIGGLVAAAAAGAAIAAAVLR